MGNILSSGPARGDAGQFENLREIGVIDVTG
jgi:hypothetical protein